MPLNFNILGDSVFLTLFKLPCSLANRLPFLMLFLLSEKSFSLQLTQIASIPFLFEIPQCLHFPQSLFQMSIYLTYCLVLTGGVPNMLWYFKYQYSQSFMRPLRDGLFIIIIIINIFVLLQCLKVAYNRMITGLRTRGLELQPHTYFVLGEIQLNLSELKIPSLRKGGGGGRKTKQEK